MFNVKEITTEKGFEIAEFAVSLFSGALFIYFVNEELFLSLEIWKLVLLSVGVTLPLFVIVKFMTDEIFWKEEDQLKKKIRELVDDEKYHGKKFEQIVDKRFRKKIHGASIRVASLFVTFSTITLAMTNLKWYHMELQTAVVCLYVVSILIVVGVARHESKKNKK